MSQIQFLVASLPTAIGLIRREQYFSPSDVRAAAKALNALDKAGEKGQDRKADFQDEAGPTLLRKLVLKAYDIGTAGSQSAGLKQLRDALAGAELAPYVRPETTVSFKISGKAKVVFRQLLDGVVVKGIEIEQMGEILDAMGDPENGRDPVDSSIHIDAKTYVKEVIEVFLAGQVRDENNRKVGIAGHMSQGLVELMDFFEVA